MSNWVRHQSFALSDAVRSAMALPQATATQKKFLESIDREIVDISKLAHANQYMLDAVRVKLCGVCTTDKLYACDIQADASRRCFFDRDPTA